MAQRIPLLIASCAAFLLSQSARAACSPADLKGDFATQPTGTILAGPTAGQFAATGVLHFDGVGKFTGVTTTSLNGQIFYPLNPFGTFTVNGDCSVTVSEVTLGLNLLGYISATKNEVVFVATNFGVAAIVTIRRLLLPSASCSNASLSGSWTWRAAGPNTVTGLNFSQAFRANFDGKGGFSGVTEFSNQGLLTRIGVTGNVQVQADCTFALKYTDQSGASSTVFGVFFGSGDQILVINSSSGSLITGDGRKGS
jgi:hypothetical protein